MTFRTIAILGLGLMGGSLAATIRRKFPSARVMGITRDRRALQFALKKNWIHEGTTDLKKGIREADWVVLCTPVDTFPDLLRKIDRFASRRLLVTDVGSVKQESVRWYEKAGLGKIRFVSAHPMVGSHERGVAAASPHLYDEGFTLLIRPENTGAYGRTPLHVYKKIKSFWKKISPRVIEISAEGHDRVTAEMSHLPHAVAVCLMLAAGKQSLPFAASGFSDMTRIAQGDASIWLPIFLANRDEVRKSLEKFEDKLKEFKNLLVDSKSDALLRMLRRAAKARKRIA